MFRKIFSIIILAVFSLAQAGFSQSAADFGPGIAADTVTLAAPLPVFRGIKIYPQEPFRFDFLMDSEGFVSDQVQNDDLIQSVDSSESLKLVKYFLASLTIPEGDLWVNLSPYEPDRILPESLGRTEMGQDMLAQDYWLKQITSSLMHPEHEVGKVFWERIYSEAYAKHQTTDIPLDTFNKVWIVPNIVEVYQNQNTAFIVKADLKVMLEEDYLARDKAVIQKTEPTYTLETKQVIRDVIIPAVEREVNRSPLFSRLRGIFHSMILAKWYEQHFKNTLLGINYVDKKVLDGIVSIDLNKKSQIYEEYVRTFKEGAYSFFKEEYDPVKQQIIPRGYFSGGITARNTQIRAVLNVDSAQLTEPWTILAVNLMHHNALSTLSQVIKSLVLGVALISLTGLKAQSVDTSRFDFWSPGIEFRVDVEPLDGSTALRSGDVTMTPRQRDLLAQAAARMDSTFFNIYLKNEIVVFVGSAIEAQFPDIVIVTINSEEAELLRAAHSRADWDHLFKSMGRVYAFRAFSSSWEVYQGRDRPVFLCDPSNTEILSVGFGLDWTARRLATSEKISPLPQPVRPAMAILTPVNPLMAELGRYIEPGTRVEYQTGGVLYSGLLERVERSSGMKNEIIFCFLDVKVASGTKALVQPPRQIFGEIDLPSPMLPNRILMEDFRYIRVASLLLPTDPAMMGRNDQMLNLEERLTQNPGGIDLNSFHLQTSGQATGIQMPMDPVMLDQPIRFLMPIIDSVQTVNLGVFLGLQAGSFPEST